MSGSTWQEKADVIDPLERREEAEMGNDAKDDGSMSRISIADGKIDKLADAWHLLDLPDCGSDCGDNQARPTVIDSRSSKVDFKIGLAFQCCLKSSKVSLLLFNSIISLAMSYCLCKDITGEPDIKRFLVD